MSRARDTRRAELERQIAARRASPAHKGLLRRLERRAMPNATGAAQTAPVASDIMRASLRTPRAHDVEPEEATASAPLPGAPVSPYPVAEAAPTDPTPTQAFAIAMGATPERRRRRGRMWVLVVLAVAYSAVAFALRDTVPEGTTIEGIPAGRSVAQATATARGIAASAANAPLILTAGDGSTSVDPASAGLAVDADATAAAVSGFTLDPTQLWHRLRGEGTDHRAVVAVDERALQDAVAAAADALDSTMADASVTITGTTAAVSAGSQAIRVDRLAARDDILAAWPTALPVAVTADVAEPAVTTRAATALAASLNSHVLAGPTTLTGPHGNATIPAAEVAESSRIERRGDLLAWTVDGASIAQYILSAFPEVQNAPTDASYVFDKRHTLQVTQGEPGRALDAGRVGDAVVAAGGTTSRTAPLPFVETAPAVTAQQLPTQDFTALVSHFRTPLTPEPVRTKNLVRAAALVTGTVIRPGEDFDLTKTIGPITAANGYYQAHVIVNGVLTNGIGGGLSQMATTTYNAGYFAGYHDVTHRPHSVWFPRYPAGRESTVYSGQINVVFTNNTPYAAIMNSYVEDGYLNVDIWSTPYYTVKTKASPKTNLVQPHMVDVAGSGCVSKGNGEPGFTITNTRWVYRGDDLVEKRSWRWTYKPDNGQRCTG